MSQFYSHFELHYFADQPQLTTLESNNLFCCISLFINNTTSKRRTEIPSSMEPLSLKIELFYTHS